MLKPGPLPTPRGSESAPWMMQVTLPPPLLFSPLKSAVAQKCSSVLARGKPKVVTFCPVAVPVVTCPDTLLAASLFATTLLPAGTLVLQQNLMHLWMHISLSLQHAQGIAHGAFCSALHSYVRTLLWLSHAIHSEITPAE